ncbi:TRAP transporter small permease [Salinarimonas sp.]|uniref:TRAP transporter small permease n=1 Tax=Salinarimonas sp. TaxID=2766526 RepID=UPI003918D905
MSTSTQTESAQPASATKADARTRGPVDLFILFCRRLSLACGIFAAAGIAFSVLLVCQLVFVRYVLNASTVWQTEVVIYTMIAATLVGAPYVQSVRGHVNVDLVPLYLGRRLRLALYCLCLLLSIAVCAVVGLYGLELTIEAYTYNWRSSSVWGPRMWPAYAAIPVGFLVWMLQLMADLVAVLTGRDRPFGIDDAEDATARVLRKEH